MNNIVRKLAEVGLPTEASPEAVEELGSDPWSDDLWDLVLAVASTPEIEVRAGETLELSLIARHALDLAQKLSALYHKHPILHEQDTDLRTVRLATARLFEMGMRETCSLLGIPLPERM